MAFFYDTALDAALATLDNVTTLHICSQEPATLAEATTTYTLGNKSSPSIGAVGDATPNGRKRTVAAITDGTLTGAGTATHWALVSGSALIATNAFSASFATTATGTFTLDAFDVTLPDFVSE